MVVYFIHMPTVKRWKIGYTSVNINGRPKNVLRKIRRIDDKANLKGFIEGECNKEYEIHNLFIEHKHSFGNDFFNDCPEIRKFVIENVFSIEAWEKKQKNKLKNEKYMIYKEKLDELKRYKLNDDVYKIEYLLEEYREIYDFMDNEGYYDERKECENIIYKIKKEIGNIEKKEGLEKKIKIDKMKTLIKSFSEKEMAYFSFIDIFLKNSELIHNFFEYIDKKIEINIYFLEYMRDRIRKYLKKNPPNEGLMESIFDRTTNYRSRQDKNDTTKRYKEWREKTPWENIKYIQRYVSLIDITKFKIMNTEKYQENMKILYFNKVRMPLELLFPKSVYDPKHGDFNIKSTRGDGIDSLIFNARNGFGGSPNYAFDESEETFLNNLIGKKEEFLISSLIYFRRLVRSLDRIVETRKREDGNLLYCLSNLMRDFMRSNKKFKSFNDFPYNNNDESFNRIRKIINSVHKNGRRSHYYESVKIPHLDGLWKYLGIKKENGFYVPPQCEIKEIKECRIETLLNELSDKELLKLMIQQKKYKIKRKKTIKIKKLFIKIKNFFSKHL